MRDYFKLFDVFDNFSFDGFFNLSEGIRIDEKPKSGDINIQIDLPGRTNESIKVFSEGINVKVIASALVGKRSRISREFSFGGGYDYNNAEAKYENGVLVITIHKLKNVESLSTKQINIQ